jgi:hypothetical protein
VTATKRGRRSDPGSVRIEVVEHGEGVTICAVYPDVDGRRNECRAGDGGHMSTRDNDVNVHFTVRVPAAWPSPRAPSTATSRRKDWRAT